MSTKGGYRTKVLALKGLPLYVRIPPGTSLASYVWMLPMLGSSRRKNYLNLLSPVSFPKGLTVSVEKSSLSHPMITFTGTGHVGAVLSAAGSRSRSCLRMKDAAAAVKGNDDPLTGAQVPGSHGVIVPR